VIVAEDIHGDAGDHVEELAPVVGGDPTPWPLRRVIGWR